MALATPDFTAADLRDPLLRARLRLLTADLEARPGCSLPAACRDGAALKGAYRFFDHPDTSAGRILPAFARPAAAALSGRRLALAVHGSTSFNFSALKGAEGLGYVNDCEAARGIHLHPSLLLTYGGDLVGIGHLHFWTRDGFRAESDEEVRALPIEGKESFKWLPGMRAVRAAFAAASPDAPPPRVVHVMDREGDVHEVFAEVRATGDHAVIRCAQDRRAEGDGPGRIGRSKARVAGRPALGEMEMRVPLKGGGYRTARVEVRAREVRLLPDETKRRKGRRPLRLGLVEVREVSAPPAGEKAASWWLWTTLRVTRLKHVGRVLRVYKARWRVEDYHRAMKTGCGAERLRLQSGERLMKALTVLAHVATRVVRLRDEAKGDPGRDCGACFSAEEWGLLWARHHGRPWRPEDGRPALGDVVRWLGRLGGHLGRNGDPVPGAECLAKALYALDLLLQGSRLGKAEAAEEDARGL